MFDLQAMMNALSDAGMRDRSRYHITLGKLTKAVTAMDDSGNVRTNDGVGFEKEHSYRGYYSDLSLEKAGSPTPKNEMLDMLERAANDEYIGYKGGEFRYDDDTPLWVAPYGCTGMAITAMRTEGKDIVLTLTDLDD